MQKLNNLIDFDVQNHVHAEEISKLQLQPNE